MSIGFSTREEEGIRAAIRRMEQERDRLDVVIRVLDRRLACGSIASAGRPTMRQPVARP